MKIQVVWIHVSDLPIEYYKRDILWRIRNVVGKYLKVDINIIENRDGGEESW